MFVKKRFETLKKKLKNKRVIIYGAGIYFQNLDCDFSQLNIVGIVDRKFTIEEAGKSFNNFRIIPYQLFDHNNADYILVVLKNPKDVIKELKSYIPRKKILSFEENSFIDKINIFRTSFDKKNTIVLIKKNGKKVFNPRIKNLAIKIDGTNNYIEIHEPFYVKEKGYIYCDSNSRLIIESNNNWRKANLLLGNNNNILMGENTTIERAECVLIGSKGTKLNIGKNCMISYNVMIRTEDAHTIYDNNTREVLNIPQDVNIGNHVWIVANSIILKGSNIPDDCIVGNYSLVNKKFEEPNCLIAGIPARIIKTDVNWDRRRTFDFK